MSPKVILRDLIRTRKRAKRVVSQGTFLQTQRFCKIYKIKKNKNPHYFIRTPEKTHANGYRIDLRLVVTDYLLQEKKLIPNAVSEYVLSTESLK